MFCLCKNCDSKCHEINDCSKCICFDECIEKTPDTTDDSDIDNI